jgi:hypothetical protein
MKTFNFFANCIDFGNWKAESLEQAQNDFASDAGYKNWADMIERSEEFGGNTVEFKEIIQKD